VKKQWAAHAAFEAFLCLQPSSFFRCFIANHPSPPALNYQFLGISTAGVFSCSIAKHTILTELLRATSYSAKIADSPLSRSAN